MMKEKMLLPPLAGVSKEEEFIVLVRGFPAQVKQEIES